MSRESYKLIIVVLLVYALCRCRWMSSTHGTIGFIGASDGHVSNIVHGLERIETALWNMHQAVESEVKTRWTASGGLNLSYISIVSTEIFWHCGIINFGSIISVCMWGLSFQFQKHVVLQIVRNAEEPWILCAAIMRGCRSCCSSWLAMQTRPVCHTLDTLGVLDEILQVHRVCT